MANSFAYSSIPNKNRVVPAARNQYIIIYKLDRKDAVSMTSFLIFALKDLFDSFHSFIIYSDLAVLTTCSQPLAISVIVHTQYLVVFFYRFVEILATISMPMQQFTITTTTDQYSFTFARITSRSISDACYWIFIFVSLDTFGFSFLIYRMQSY